MAETDLKGDYHNRPLFIFWLLPTNFRQSRQEKMLFAGQPFLFTPFKAPGIGIAG